MLKGLLIFVLIVFAADHFPQGIGGLEWMRGCWSFESGGRKVTEHWMKPEGRSMLGISRTIQNDKTTGYEYIRIVEDDTGHIYYIAHPSGQKETAFKMTNSDNSSAVFENPQHDFPSKIIYKFISADSLTAAIEGNIDGKIKRIEFRFRKTACE